MDHAVVWEVDRPHVPFETAVLPGGSGRSYGWTAGDGDGGPDPDSGTAWEVGYAFGTRKPVVLVCTDVRALAGDAGDNNPMLTQAATARIDLPAASITEVVAAILGALARIEADERRPGGD